MVFVRALGSDNALPCRERRNPSGYSYTVKQGLVRGSRATAIRARLPTFVGSWTSILEHRAGTYVAKCQPRLEES